MPKTSRRGAIDHLFSNNKAWVDSILKTDPDYFAKWASSQAPKYFWLGCADSRVVAEACTGLKVGDLFVHRNVGNILSHTDVNGMSALEYSVKSLGVQHVLVCGHTNCGAVNAALRMPSKSQGITNCWISQIRTTRNEHAAEIAALPRDQQVLRLVKLNVLQQVFNVCTSPVLQQAWDAGQDVHVHGLLYDVATGSLELLVGPISSNAEVPEDDPGEFANVSASKKSLGAALESMMLKTDSQSQLGEASMHSHHMRKASVISSDAFTLDEEKELNGDEDNASWLQHLASGVGKAQSQEKQRMAKAINSHIAFESTTGSFDPAPSPLMQQQMADRLRRNNHMHDE